MSLDNNTSRKREGKNLDNVDFTNRKIRVQTPHSKMVLLELGLEEDKLYKITKKEYLDNHPELKQEKTEIQDKRYEHYEKRRQEAIDQARQIRTDIIAKDSDYNIEIKFYDINTKAISIKRWGVNDKVKNKNYAFTLAIVQREINDKGLSSIKNIYYFYDCHFYDFSKRSMTIKQLKELFPNYHEEKIS